MANIKIPVDALSKTVMRELNKYADLVSEDMKAAVKKAGSTARKEISATAPRNTGAYAKSWTVKTTRESARALEVTVHSRNRYQLAHLLEHGHAKRGGGRVAARPHIAQAEELAVEPLQQEIERNLRHG